MAKNRLIVGCGYVGERIAKKWIMAGDRVYGVTRSLERSSKLSSLGIIPIHWNWYEPFVPAKLPWLDSIDFDSIVISVSHAKVESLDAEQTHTFGLDHLISMPAVASRLDKIRWCYLSTTGVYASVVDGRWMDERSEIQPARDGSRAARSGEVWMQNKIAPDKRIILRPAGIYGPNRIPRLDLLARGDKIDVDPDSFLNLIHVEDLTTCIDFACKVNASQLSDSEVFNVSDLSPVKRRDYYQFICDRMKYPSPSFARETLSTDSTAASPDRILVVQGKSGLKTRGEGNKRIDSKKIHAALQNYRGSPAEVFQFADYRSGLSNLLGNVAASF